MKNKSGGRQLIDFLALERHPEGGWYREIYRATELIPAAALPAGFGGERAFTTAIYFLLTPSEFPALHRIKSLRTFPQRDDQMLRLTPTQWCRAACR
ncbi:MAG: cupin domain-containing protein [Desulfobulbaceae bacterium]|nr:cupin domain-containing protein [Desulfobulbaceae bacterium]